MRLTEFVAAPGSPFLKLKIYSKLSELFSNVKYYTHLQIKNKKYI